MNQFQDLNHLDGLSISTVCANLYDNKRDDLVMFYFRDGANFASVYTQSQILSENIKWNLSQKSKKTDFGGPRGSKSCSGLSPSRGG